MTIESLGFPDPTQRPKTRQLLLSRISHFVDRISDQAVDQALSSDDFGAILTLASEDIWNDQTLTPIQQARIDGVRYRRELLARAGGGLSLDEVASMLEISSEAVRKRIQRGTLIGIRAPRGYRIPAIQFQESVEMPGLRRVLVAMEIKSPWMRLNWLLSPEPRLDNRAPLTALQDGESIERVAQAAAMLGEHGAA